MEEGGGGVRGSVERMEGDGMTSEREKRLRFLDAYEELCRSYGLYLCSEEWVSVGAIVTFDDTFRFEDTLKELRNDE